MLIAYGHTKIEWGDRVFILSPTFANIAKIGGPKEIIDTFKEFIETTNLAHKFSMALNILDCCSDISLPEELTGTVRPSANNDRILITQPKHGINMVNDIIVLAEHCLIHGICGKSDKKQDGEPVTEFDAYSFMELARIHLGLSATDAAQMTMTEFSRMMEAKFPPQIDENAVNEDEQIAMGEWLAKQNKKVH